MDALKGFPSFDTKLNTEKGDAICQKQDIFKGMMWFAYTNDFANWHMLKIEQVNEIIAENKLNKKVASLEDFEIEVVQEPEKHFNNAMGQESLTRFDQPKKKKKPNKKRKPGGENVIVANNTNTNPVNKNNTTNKPNINNKQNQNPNNKNNNNKRPNNNAKPNVSGEKKPAEPRKPIIITKNETKE
jgi:signal peptidase I